MSTKKILVVFGATGNQGGSVINSILNDPTAAAQFEIVGVTRDPSKPAAVALAARGVKPVKASTPLALTKERPPDILPAG